MRYLTGEEILIIHARIIDAVGGRHGIRDTNLFLSILEKPKTIFNGKELYSGIFAKTAVYLESLANYHVFIDGNKRTAITVSAYFLHLNGYKLKASQKDMAAFVLSVVTEKKNLNLVANWLRKNSRKIK